MQWAGTGEIHDWLGVVRSAVLNLFVVLVVVVVVWWW